MNVARAGFFTTVQDLGRVGFRKIGVPVGGALDTHALRIANLLVGNREGCAGIEIAFGGVQLRFDEDRLVAWCGGGFPVRINEWELLPGRAARIRARETLSFERTAFGSRAWAAISGGVDVPLVLGSRSTDTRGRFGGFDGRTLKDGDALPLGKESDATARIAHSLGSYSISLWSAPAEWSTVGRAPGLLRFVKGTDWNRFQSSAHAALTNEAFRVSPESDRMGVRFENARLRLKDTTEVSSEPVAPGTIQVPPSGQPILLLGDCQTVGGYPKIAHVITVDLPIAAQLHSPEKVHFREISMTEAHRLFAEREEDLMRFGIGLDLRMG